MIKWSEISEHDKKEILNLLAFKRQIKEKLLPSTRKNDIIKTVKER